MTKVRDEADAKRTAARAIHSERKQKLKKTIDLIIDNLQRLRSEDAKKKEEKQAAAKERAIQQEKQKLALQESRKILKAAETAERRQKGEGSFATIVWVQLISAEGIIAADKGGTSDAYAVAELVSISTGKLTKQPRKSKTKTIKKTLAPVWNEAVETWDKIEEDVTDLAIKVTVFDADMLSSEALGGVLISLSTIWPSLWVFSEVVIPLKATERMKNEATGTLKVRLRVRRDFNERCTSSQRLLPLLPAVFDSSLRGKNFTISSD